MIKLTTFLNRLSKIGISLQCSLNYPWVYVEKINDTFITEKYGSEHGWVLGFITKNDDFYCEHSKEIFKLIRKYK